MNKLPVAWKQLSKQKMKTLVAIAGITFADMLMFLQLGIKDALFDSAVQFHKSLRGEIVLVSRRYQSLVALNRFPERRLYQVSGFAGVQSVTPIYLDRSDWKNPENGQTWSMFTIGFNPREQVVNLEGVAENQQALTFPDVVLFDRGSRSEYGAIAAELQAGKTVTTEVENRRVQAVGLFKLGTSFGINGNLITSDSNFLRLMRGKRQKSAIDVGLVKLETGADREAVVRNLRKNLPDDVRVLTKEGFIELEKNYWANSTPIGYTFTLGAIIGFIVGAVIVYQILYSDVIDHLSEYATLKAIGFKNRYLLKIVFQSALILAALGFLPGIGLASFFYANMRDATLLPIAMTGERALLVFILTGSMCTVSAALATRKLQSADPAEVF